MNIYRVPFARLRDWQHPKPNATAFRPMRSDFDYTCRAFSSRVAMLKACEKSEGVFAEIPWKPLIP